MKWPKSIFMGVILILSLPFSSQGAFAATPPTSNATVTFTQEGLPGSQLSLVDVPSLNFGSVPVSLTDINNVNPSTDASVTVTDERSISYAQGWSLTVSASYFTDASTKTLAGASIIFNPSGNPLQTPDLGFPKPTTSDVTFTISADGKTGTDKLITAAAGAGRGTWITTWTAANVVLHVPGGSMDATSYSSTLTWALSNTP